MYPTVSTVPACLKALVAAAERANPDAVVTLGQPTRGQALADDVICVAFTGEPEEAAVISSRERQQGATAPDRESYDVQCIASSWRGNSDDPIPVLDATFGLIDAFAAELAADQTLGGVVMTCRISADSTAQVQTDRGATTVGRFTVHVEAFTGAW